MRRLVAAGIMATVLAGCAYEPLRYGCPQPAAPQSPPSSPMLAYANPVFIPTADSEKAWEQVVAVVGAYFRIEREEPIRMLGNTRTEGTITTVAEVSPTVLEPWRRDTVDLEQRVENTLQSMRRRAVIRVIPAQDGHWVDVAVYKELENVVQPEHATAGAATFPYDTSATRIENPIAAVPIAQAWIARGRDTSLEQFMIGDLLSR